MNITDIRVRRISAEGRMKAVVSVTFDDAFVVHDIKVIEGQDKLFIAMPSRKTLRCVRFFRQLYLQSTRNHSKKCRMKLLLNNYILNISTSPSGEVVFCLKISGLCIRIVP